MGIMATAGALGGLGAGIAQIGNLTWQDQVAQQRAEAEDQRSMRRAKYNAQAQRDNQTWALDEADRRSAAKEKSIADIIAPAMADNPATPTVATDGTTPNGEIANPALKSEYNPANGADIAGTKKTQFEKAMAVGDALTNAGKVKEAQEYYNIADKLKKEDPKLITLAENSTLFDPKTNKVIATGTPKKLSIDEQAIAAYMEKNPGTNAFDAKEALVKAGRTPPQPRQPSDDDETFAAWKARPENKGKDRVDYKRDMKGVDGEKETTLNNSLVSTLKSMLGADRFGSLKPENAQRLADALPIAKKYHEAGMSIEEATSQAMKDVVAGKKAASKPTLTQTQPKTSDKKPWEKY